MDISTATMASSSQFMNLAFGSANRERSNSSGDKLDMQTVAGASSNPAEAWVGPGLSIEAHKEEEKQCRVRVGL